MEILLTYKAHGKGNRDPYTALLPVGLGTLNAMLRKEGHRSRIANLSTYTWQEIGRLFAEEPPDLLGISQFSHNRSESLRLARMAKEANPECFVVFGGPHATHRFREILSQNDAIDVVVLGEHGAHQHEKVSDHGGEHAAVGCNRHQQHRDAARAAHDAAQRARTPDLVTATMRSPDRLGSDRARGARTDVGRSAIGHRGHALPPRTP